MTSMDAGCASRAGYERETISRSRDGFYHPSCEDDLVALVRLARGEGRQLRVRGAAHSVPKAIHTDDGAPGRVASPRHVELMLDRYSDIRFDDARMEVTVEAGCHLGDDPRDPTRMATWERSLLARLEAKGWALPDLAGVTHQTVSGFLMTGSCGGTVRHAIEDAVVALRLVDGTGRAHDLRRGRDELFDAAVCSMGLLGVVSTVTLQCVPRYDVIGRESTCEETGGTPDLLGGGASGLEAFLRSTEYARLVWWPQDRVRRVVTWEARRMEDADYDATTGDRGALRPKRYSAFGDRLPNETLARAANVASQWAGGLFYDAVALGAVAGGELASRWPRLSPVGRRARAAFAHRVLPAVLDQFVPLGPPQRFWGPWFDTLPMDNAMSEDALPTDFTEIWVPLDRTHDVMRTLRAHYDRHGHDATGSFLCEVYAARATRGWMHPGYGRDSLRIDLFWFRRNRTDPTGGWFVQFWELLRSFAYRLHWGKHLPRERRLCADHLRSVTPRWDDFLAARARLDPDGVFFTSYWRQKLLGSEP